MLRSFLQGLLSFFSKRIIKKYRPDIVGITGSVGKTSTKEATAIVLSCRFNVRKSAKNYNNEIGLPLTILGFDKSPGRSIWGWLKVFITGFKLILIKDKKYPDILVLEMGADKPGDIKHLVELAPPKVGVWTSIAHVHTEFFKTLKKIVLEKREIISSLSHDGYAVVNFDDDYVMENIDKTKAEIFTYGFKEGADLRASQINLLEGENGPKGINFKVFYKGNTVPVLLNGVVAEHLIPSCLAGLAIGLVFGVNLVDGAEELKKLEPISGHMRILKGIKNTLLIDDTYNSSPKASRSALETLLKLETNSQRYAVLGDMLELGTETENAHREVGFKVSELEIDYLVTVGEASKNIALSAKEAGMSEDKIYSFADSVSAGKFLQEKIKEKDILLVKGSQSIRMEKIVKELMAEPLRAEELLVRQGEEWNR